MMCCVVLECGTIASPKESSIQVSSPKEHEVHTTGTTGAAKLSVSFDSI